MQTPTLPRHIAQRCVHCTTISPTAQVRDDTDVLVCDACLDEHDRQVETGTLSPKLDTVSQHGARRREVAVADEEHAPPAETKPVQRGKRR